MASNDCVFQKSCNYMGKMLKIHQKRRDSFISVCPNKESMPAFTMATTTRWHNSVYMHISITLLKTRGKLLTSKSVQAVPEWTNS